MSPMMCNLGRMASLGRATLCDASGVAALLQHRQIVSTPRTDQAQPQIVEDPVGDSTAAPHPLGTIRTDWT